MLLKRKPSELKKLSPNKKRLDRGEFYVYGFPIESDGMAAAFVIKCPGRPTAEGYTKFLCDALGTDKYNADTDGGIFAFGTLTTSPEEDHILKNSRGFEFRGFFVTDTVDLRENNFAQLKIRAQQLCDVSDFCFITFDVCSYHLTRRDRGRR